MIEMLDEHSPLGARDDQRHRFGRVGPTCNPASGCAGSHKLCDDQYVELMRRDHVSQSRIATSHLTIRESRIGLFENVRVAGLDASSQILDRLHLTTRAVRCNQGLPASISFFASNNGLVKSA